MGDKSDLKEDNGITLKKVPPLEIKERSWKKDPKFIWTLVISLIALIFSFIAVLPIIYGLFQQSEFHGKIFDFYFSPPNQTINVNNVLSGTTLSHTGTEYIFKTSIIVSQKDFNVKSFNISMKYPDNTTKTGVPYTCYGRYDEFGSFNIPDIYTMTIMEKDKPREFIVCFIVPNTTESRFLSMTLFFYDYNNLIKKLTFYSEDITNTATTGELLQTLLQPKKS